jgi:hypothetical protein
MMRAISAKDIGLMSVIACTDRHTTEGINYEYYDLIYYKKRENFRALWDEHSLMSRIYGWSAEGRGSRA